MGSIDRARNHKKGSRNYRWWEEMKANPNYKFVIVDRSLTKQQAWDIEIDLISKFGRQHIDSDGILTNIHPGGSFYGEAAKDPVVAFTLEGVRIGRYESISMARKVLCPEKGKQWVGSIWNCCRYKSKSFNNYQWFYESEVGDIDYIGPIKRKQTSGGHNTRGKFYIDATDGEVFSSKRNAGVKMFPGYAKGGGILASKKFKNRMLEISKEEYNILKEL